MVCFATMSLGSLHLDAAQRSRRKLPDISVMDAERAAKACVSLARETRESAETIESAWSRLEQSGVLFEAVRLARRNGSELPQADVIEAARVLRAYAGAIFLFAASLAPKPRDAEVEPTEELPLSEAAASGL